MPSAERGTPAPSLRTLICSPLRLQVLNITESEAIVKLSDGEMKVLDKGTIGLLHGAGA